VASARSLAARSIDGDLADAAEERLAEQAFQARAGKVLRLGKEDHLPRKRQRREEVIGEREVVAGQDGGPGPRHVVGSLGPRTEH
jgi:hypothetical protein